MAIIGTWRGCGRSNQGTPGTASSRFGKLEIAWLLLDHGAQVDALDVFVQTPLRQVPRGTYDPGLEEVGVRVAHLLLERGWDVNTQSKKQHTPLHVTSSHGKFEVARLLLDHGAKVDAVDNFGKTPLHKISVRKYDPEAAGVGVARLLLERAGM